MRQLSAFDALMVYGDNSRTPMHVSPLFIYDQSTAPGGLVRFKDILKTFQERLPLAPVLRQKLLRVPLDLDEPYWVDAVDFDIEQHIRHLALPKPGDRRQLSILLARINAYPMDLSRPPWDAFVIEGLDHVDGVPPGSFAMLLRIHHSAIDGHSGHAILQVIHDLEPAGRRELPIDNWKPRPEPSRSELLQRAYYSLLTKPRKLIKVASDVFPAVRRVRELKRRYPDQQRPVPETRFSGAVSPHRVVLLVTLPMDGFRVAKNAVQSATINDAVVCVAAGALRRYLIAKKELPEQSMTTVMPINIRTEAERDQPGNVVSITTLDMHSDIADPLLRLKAIHESATYSKAYHNAVGARIMSDVAESIPAGIMSVGARVGASVGVLKIPANTIVTNVPGPQVPLFLAGAKVIEFHALGILLDGLGLFHAVNSYCGRVSFTVVADRKMMPDPQFYEQCLRESYAESVQVASSQPALGSRRKPAKSARKRAAKSD
jgi:WS/DGAT/MGAT family acyltransferase